MRLTRQVLKDTHAISHLLCGRREPASGSQLRELDNGTKFTELLNCRAYLLTPPSETGGSQSPVAFLVTH